METRNPTFSRFVFSKFFITHMLPYLWWQKAVQLRLDTAGGTLLVIWRHCANCCAPFTHYVLLYSCSAKHLCL